MNHLRLDISQPDRITIWIDVRERSVNVLSEPVFAELRQSLDEVQLHAAGRPVVLRSAKSKAFVVGADLRRIVALQSDQQVQQFLLYGQETLERLERFPGHTVAYIRGPCLGGGLELALACRFRVACDTAQTQFGMPEAQLGLMPGWGGTQRLIESIGFEAGIQMLLSGAPVDAKTAFALGLVDAIGGEADCETALTKFLQALGCSAEAAAEPHSGIKQSSVAQPQIDWDRLWPEPLTAAQYAILKAVAAGVQESREAGMRAERELFFPLLGSAAVREKLQRFAGPSP